MEEAAYEYFAKIDELGGMVEAIKQNYPQREIADASFRYQEEVDRGERIVVGVNRYEHEDEDAARDPAHPAGARAQAGRPGAGGARAPRRRRGRARASASCARPRRPTRNLMEPLLDCARAHCSEGEIVESLQRVFGTYTETPVF